MPDRFTHNLVIFARAPRRGAVKRRLAADIGDGAAITFYRNTLRDTLRRLGGDPRWRTWLAVTPDSAVTGAQAGLLTPPLTGVSGISKRPQGAGHLGIRMRRPLLLPGRPGALPPGPAVIVGSDIPGITPAHIARAFAALGSHDFVFGPATDGGYWLAGARRRPALPHGLFDGVRWSSEHALADTLAGLPASVRVALIDALDDVDDGAAYERWRVRRGLAHAA